MRNLQKPQNAQTPQNIHAAMRAAFGPGFQAGGPSEAMLRVVVKQARP
jgi:hypothetical protein